MYQNELYHHGVKGQKWGVRRFQKIDGSMTPEGKRQAAIKNLRRATKHIYGEGNAKVIFDKASRARKNDPLAKYKNSTGYDKHDIAMKKIKESRVILGAEITNNIIESQIARESNKAVASAAVVAAGIAVVRNMAGFGIPTAGIIAGTATAAGNSIRNKRDTQAYLRIKGLYD